MKFFLVSVGAVFIVFLMLMTWVSTLQQNVRCPANSAYVTRLDVCISGAFAPIR